MKSPIIGKPDEAARKACGTSVMLKATGHRNVATRPGGTVSALGKADRPDDLGRALPLLSFYDITAMKFLLRNLSSRSDFSSPVGRNQKTSHERHLGTPNGSQLLPGTH